MRPNSYPKVLALGHRYLDGIFDGDYTIEEKIDGSQISFGLYDGELCIRSKGAQLYADNPDGMFVEAVKSIVGFADKLIPNWTYRGEYLRKPKHNTLNYGRVPEKHIIIFDIEDNIGNPTKGNKAEFASTLGLECVPSFQVERPTLENIKSLLEADSCLGGQKIEGIVVKNYNNILPDGKYMVGKYVSEAFKERHKREWRAENPNNRDIVEQIIDSLKTEARWLKAVQHLKENGEYTESPKDIGNLLKEIHSDIDAEEEDYIKGKLYDHHIKNIKRGVCGGFPEWYKEYLMTNSGYME